MKNLRNPEKGDRFVEAGEKYVVTEVSFFQRDGARFLVSVVFRNVDGDQPFVVDGTEWAGLVWSGDIQGG